jgi:hypothetical protein
MLIYNGLIVLGIPRQQDDTRALLMLANLPHNK